MHKEYHDDTLLNILLLLSLNIPTLEIFNTPLVPLC